MRDGRCVGRDDFASERDADGSDGVAVCLPTREPFVEVGECYAEIEV